MLRSLLIMSGWFGSSSEMIYVFRPSASGFSSAINCFGEFLTIPYRLTVDTIVGNVSCYTIGKLLGSFNLFHGMTSFEAIIQ